MELELVLEGQVEGAEPAVSSLAPSPAWVKGFPLPVLTAPGSKAIPSPASPLPTVLFLPLPGTGLGTWP